MNAELTAIGVDLGGTKIASVLVSCSGEVLATRQALTRPAEGPEAVLDRLAAEIDALALQAPGRLVGVGVGSPGWGDYRGGVIHKALNLGWTDVNVVAGVTARLQHTLPIWLEKDTHASTLGEYYFGAGHGCADFVYIAVGTGLGSGVIVNGQLAYGAEQIGADLGHISLDPLGRPCTCGLHGCAETILSGLGLVSAVSELLTRAHPASLLDGWRGAQDLTPTLILEAARKGDPVAAAAFSEAGAALGFILAVSVAAFNPARVVIGGGLGAAAFDLLVPSARLELACRIPLSRWENVQIVPSQLVSSAIGAACLVWERSKT